MKLKERAVYQLPNGRELVAVKTQDDSAVLYNLSASMPGLYELNSEGRLLFEGRLTAWEIDDLLETGRVAAPEVELYLVERARADQTMDEQQT